MRVTQLENHRDAANAPPLLDVRQLGSGVVNPVSFTLCAGECVGIRGVSGAGKTRLLRLIADLDDGSGDVWLDGVSRHAFSGPAWRGHVVYQSAEPAWWEPTAIDHISAPHRDWALDLADRLGLAGDRMTAAISTLSTGERQRAALVRSLSVSPQVLMLDEPTSALDTGNTARVEALLCERMAAGMGVLLISHFSDQVARLTARTIDIQRKAMP